MKIREALINGLEEQLYQVKLVQETQLTGYDPSHPDALHIEGNKVMKGTQQVSLRGVSFAGWEANWNKVEQHITSLMADVPLSQNMNVVRMPIQGNALTGTTLAAFIQERMIPVVALLNSHGFYVIIDYHPIVDWDRVTVYDRTEEFWQAVAPAFKDNPKVLYELINEPINPASDTIEIWTSFVRYFQPIVNLIRANAPDNIIIIGSPNWTTRIKYAAQVPFVGKNLMYAYHIYPNIAATVAEGLSSWMQNQIPESIPVFITEFGYSVGANHHAELSNNPYFKEEFENYCLKRPYTCWTAWNYDDASIPAMLAPNGAASKDWVSNMLNIPVNFVPPAPLPAIASLSGMAGTLRVWDADQEGGLTLDGNGLIEAIKTPSQLNNTEQSITTKRPTKGVYGYRTYAGFDGGKFMTIPTPDDFVGGKQKLSIVLICRPSNSDAADRRILTIQSATGGAIEIFRKGAGNISAMVKSKTSTSAKYPSGANIIPDGKWIAIIATLDGSTGKCTLRYSGSTPKAEIVTVADTFFASGTTMTLGANAAGQSLFKGDVLALSVIDHALSQEECNQVFNLVEAKLG